MPDTGSPPARKGYALPYYTRNGGDTEYLLSNPGSAPVNGQLIVFGPDCKPAGEPLQIKLAPNCTQSVRVRPVVPDNAGHAIAAVDGPLVISILYSRANDLAVVGNALAAADLVLDWPAAVRAKTYGFGFRTLPLGPDTLDASLFVSNPSTHNLGGLLTLYEERCTSLLVKKFSIAPNCTREFALPAGHYGYGRIRVLAPAVLSLLHFAKSAAGVTAAELLGESNRVEDPPPVGTGLLIDYTHGCRGAAAGDMTDWEAAIAATGVRVDRLTTPPLTLAALQIYRALAVIVPRTAYSAAEVQAVSDFVKAGGGLLVAQDYGVDPPTGPMPWSWPTRSVLGAFGLIDDNNLVEDALHNDGQPGWVVFEAQRCFQPHPIVNGLAAISVDAV